MHVQYVYSTTDKEKRKIRHTGMMTELFVLTGKLHLTIHSKEQQPFPLRHDVIANISAFIVFHTQCVQSLVIYHVS